MSELSVDCPIIRFSDPTARLLVQTYDWPQDMPPWQQQALDRIGGVCCGGRGR